jgi:hypothetical protein
MTEQASLAERIETIERAYEFMLAYAAQGREDEEGGSIREYLERADAALDGLASVAASSLAIRDAATLRAYADFLAVLEGDAGRARAALRLVLVRPTISSQLIDNLNASIHLRALLTDVFLIDESLKRGTG